LIKVLHQRFKEEGIEFPVSPLDRRPAIQQDGKSPVSQRNDT